MIGTVMSTRLVEQAERLHAGDVSGVVDWLVALGARDPVVGGTGRRFATVTGLTGIRVGLQPSDPIACVASIGLAVLGPTWPTVAPDLISLTVARWNARRKAAIAQALA